MKSVIKDRYRRAYEKDNFILCETTDGKVVTIAEVVKTGDKVLTDSNCEIIKTAFNLSQEYDLEAFEPCVKALQNISPMIENLINRTPTGDNRNDLTIINILVKTALLKINDKE